MAYNCPLAYRKKGDVSLHCHGLPQGNDWCGFQHFCGVTKMWENTDKARSCLILKKSKEENK